MITRHTESFTTFIERNKTKLKKKLKSKEQLEAEEKLNDVEMISNALDNVKSNISYEISKLHSK